MIKKNKKWKIFGAVLAGIVVIALGITAFVGNYLVTYALGRSGEGGNREVSLEVEGADAQAMDTLSQNRALQQEKTADFLGRVQEEQVSIQSADGLTLSGAYYKNEKSEKWAIVVHGYRGSREGMMKYAQRYYDAGYQVLAPDLRACGQSEGEYVGMGWSDKDDMLRWIDWIVSKDAQARIVLHGVSMGAATVMMTAGEYTPDAVRAFVEDCGYTSVWDIFASELKLRFKLPTFPALDMASLFAQLRAGWNFKEASALEQVKKCEKPMLFIHGEQDDFVPYEMLNTLYEAKPGENKRRLSVPDAGHGEASDVMGEAYWDEIFDFIEPYMI